MHTQSYALNLPVLSTEQMAGMSTARMLASYTRSAPSSRSAFSGGNSPSSIQFIFSTFTAVVLEAVVARGRVRMLDW